MGEMVQKCPAKYKNLNYIQSFSEQGYATIQLMQQACMNDEWLRQRVLKLNYLTAPAVRKWYRDGEWINDDISYGYSINPNGEVGFNSLVEKEVIVDFINDDEWIDFDKTDAIIMSQDGTELSTTLVTNDELQKNDYDEHGNLLTVDDVTGEITGTTPIVDVQPQIRHWCQLPFEDEAEKKIEITTVVKPKEVLDTTTTTIVQNQGTNSAWYVGFNKKKNYYVRPDWLHDWRDSEIPSVARGQTFKARVSGKLASIDLRLDYNGTLHSDCGSPLYVQIWKTKQQKVVKTVWNKTKKTQEKVYRKHANNKGGDYNRVNGKYVRVKKGTGAYSLVYETISVPDTTNTGIYKPLAHAEYNPSQMQSFGVVNIVFDKEVDLKAGQSYFIALFSPLSEWKHCPRWGGWGRNCLKDKKYAYGHAFLSENNGRTWIRYGRNDMEVPYKKGKLVPQDFAFTCHIRTKSKIDTITEEVINIREDAIDDAGIDNPRYLYLKPIYCNPAKTIKISAEDDGDSIATDGKGLKYQFSIDNGVTWHTATLNTTYEFTEGERPERVLVRAILYRTIGSETPQEDEYYNVTPKIYSLSVTLHTELPKKMYVRTHEWQPRTDAMLGARIWGRVFSPFETDPTVTCNAEIVTNEQPTEHFTIIEVENVLTYCESKVDEKYLEDPDYESILKTAILELRELNNPIPSEICDYLYKHKEVLTELKKYNIYVKPFIIEENETEYMYLLSFTPSDMEDMKILSTDEFELSGMPINDEVAYPIVTCAYTPEGGGEVVTLSEGYDFTIDYDENTFNIKHEVLSQMTLGDIGVTFNRCFLKGLSNDELGVHVDNETGLKEEGLILDYFKETFNITNTNVETRRVKLRVKPVDPIREVVLNRDTDDEVELYEGFDYVLDLNTNEIEFNVVNIDGVSSILKSGDVLEVVYTPNLQATALSLGYWCTRKNTDKQVRIKNSYWEYKA